MRCESAKVAAAFAFVTRCDATMTNATAVSVATTLVDVLKVHIHCKSFPMQQRVRMHTMNATRHTHTSDETMAQISLRGDECMCKASSCSWKTSVRSQFNRERPRTASPVYLTLHDACWHDDRASGVSCNIHRQRIDE